MKIVWKTLKYKSLALTVINKSLIVSNVFLLTCCASFINNDNGQFISDHHAKNSSYLERLFKSDTSSADLSCLDQIEYFRDIDQQNYMYYKAEYDIIIDGFHFLDQNASLMTAETKRVYEMKLDIHLNSLCTKLQYSVYKMTKEKLAAEHLAGN